MILERLPHKLIGIILVRKVATLAQNLSLNVAHVSLGYQSPTTEVISLVNLPKDHLQKNTVYGEAKLIQTNLFAASLTKSL